MRNRSAIATKKFPWASLALLLVTYGVLGWQLSAFQGHRSLWAMAAIASVLASVAVCSPWLQVRRSFFSLFATDTRAFLVATVLAFLSVVVITWLHIFFHILVVFAASTLVRIDTQTARWTSRQSFWLIAIASLAGLALGALGETTIEPYLSGEWGVGSSE